MRVGLFASSAYRMTEAGGIPSPPAITPKRHEPYRRTHPQRQRVCFGRDSSTWPSRMQAPSGRRCGCGHSEENKKARPCELGFAILLSPRVLESPHSSAAAENTATSLVDSFRPQFAFRPSHPGVAAGHLTAGWRALRQLRHLLGGAPLGVVARPGPRLAISPRVWAPDLPGS
jgi:hypothetical protein